MSEDPKLGFLALLEKRLLTTEKLVVKSIISVVKGFNNQKKNVGRRPSLFVLLSIALKTT